MAETSLREGLREARDQARPSEINPKLEEAVQNQPLLPHLLAWDVVLKALAIGAVVAVVLLILASPMFAGIGLLVTFFGAWFALAALSYGKASERSSESSDSASDSDSDSESDEDDDE